jgi:TrmH family RNA methyltransferase
MLIKSQVKYIQSLSHKKSRDSEDVFIAEGPKLINELLYTPHLQLQQLFALKDWLGGQSGDIQKKAVEISQQELERISFLQTPNQVLGIFKKPVFAVHKPVQGSVTLMLDTIQDPGNMGTIIRCADWFGIEQVFCSTDSADVFNPKVVQASMGSIGRVQVHYQPLEAVLQQYAGVPAYAAVLDGVNLRSMPPIQQGIIVIGNESKGISQPVLDLCRHRVTIPRHGHAESLNASVAAGIILSHLIS